MGLRSITEATIFDAGHNPPRRRLVRTGPLGPIYEKLPNLPIERWVNRRGHVVNIALSGGASLREVDCPKESSARRDEIRRSGGIPYHECPVRTGAMFEEDFPADMRDVCPRGTYGHRKACPHVEYVVALRQKDHARQEEARTERQRRAKQADQIRHQELLDALRGGAVARLADPPPPPPAPEPVPEIESKKGKR